MRVTWEMVRLELKLFLREPLTLVFTLALPVVILYVLGGVFGNMPGRFAYRGVGAMDFYVPAYVGLVISSMGLIALPVHLAGYRERGVLRRFRASGVPTSAVLIAQVAKTFAVAVVGGGLVVGLAEVSYQTANPVDVGGVLVAFFVSVLAFTAIGVLLGVALPTARAAQGAGVLLWFVMLIVSGAGPPPGTLTDAMRSLGEVTPLRHVIVALQDPWLGFGWNAAELAFVAAIGAGAVAVSALVFRRASFGAS